jgi:hypothetical protein
MKIEILFVLILTILCSCSEIVRFVPCQTTKPQELIESKIIPVKSGNLWRYNLSGVYGSGKEIFKVMNLDTIYYYDSTGKKPIPAYKLKHDKNPNDNLNYYIKCEESVVLATVGSQSGKIIKYGWTYEENPVINSRNANNEYFSQKNEFNRMFWEATADITVPAGQFKCFVMAEITKSARYDEFKKVIIYKEFIGARRYYSKGVGLVKLSSFDENNQLVGSYELESYELK